MNADHPIPDHRLAAHLDPEQAQAVFAPRGPVCILAGAGTGKTRTVTHRIAYLVDSNVHQPQQLLAVTFTTRAAGEMRARLRGLGVEGVQARTFHAAALRQLRYFWPRTSDGAAVPDLLDNKIRLVAQAAARARLRTDKTAVRDLAGEVEWARSSLVDPEDYAARVAATGRDIPMDAADVVKVMTTYAELKQRTGVIDFEDILMTMAYLIESHEDVARQIRSQYRSFVVDEYQDVTPLQQRLLDGWLGERDDVCVVGDANQTIYTFTGAQPDFLVGFARRYPRATVVQLERDYRSTPEVVGLANQVIAQAQGALASAKLRLIGQRPAGPTPRLTGYDDEPAEAQAVATRAGELIADGTAPAEIAVLFRTNAQSEAYEAALSAQKIAYVLRGGARFFERPEIREAVLFLRAGARGEPADPTTALPDRVRSILEASGWDPEAPPTGGAARDRWESVAALVGLAEEMTAATPEIVLPAFLIELDQRAAASHAPTVQGVTLASLHAAKGLEWDAVFLVGVADGTLPIQRARTAAQVEEERRLLYVGITRAREVLEVSWSAARAPGGRASRKPSRFLDPVLGSAAPTTPSQRAKRGKVVRCRGCGQPLSADRIGEGQCARCQAAGSETFESLRQWRRGEAKEAGVPPYVVFDDETLSAIAQARPVSLGTLLKVKGVGETKLGRYGSSVLEVVGSDPA